MSFNFKYIGSYDVKRIVDKVNKFTESDWDYWTFKQKEYEVHKSTKTIPLLFDENYGNHFDANKSIYYHLFKTELDELTDIFTNFYGIECSILRAEIARLEPNSVIPTHYDTGDSLILNQRIHLCVRTNKYCVFTISGEPKHIKLGEIWEINNESEHSVENGGVENRIHMILDVKQKKIFKNIL
jgi:hypothetical protein